MPDTPSFRIPAQRQRGLEHRPFCTNHIPGADLADFGVCMSSDMDLPGMAVALMWREGESVRASICTGEVMEIISLDELERRSLAMLTTALIGRGLTPPTTALTELAGTVTT